MLPVDIQYSAAEKAVMISFHRTRVAEIVFSMLISIKVQGIHALVEVVSDAGLLFKGAKFISKCTNELLCTWRAFYF